LLNILLSNRAASRQSRRGDADDPAWFVANPQRNVSADDIVILANSKASPGSLTGEICGRWPGMWFGQASLAGP
jgi:hypothetical protein